MAYVTWDWSQSGYPSNFSPSRKSPQLRNENDAAYVQTRPQWTRDLWVISLEFSIIRPASYTYLIDFFHTHRGGAFFYWMWPYGLYGIPPEYYTADPGGLSPWSSELTPGFGEAMTLLVRFGMNEFPVSRRKTAENIWATTSPIILEQI